jgi:CelD/BcsL family acetyltransferase involved in cellulose biosynthesis
VLLAELFKYCRAEELAELDFSVGDEAFKNRFSNVTRHTMRFRTFRSGVYQRLDWANRALRERGKRVKVVREVHSMLHRPQGLAWPLRVQRTGQRLGSDLTV